MCRSWTGWKMDSEHACLSPPHNTRDVYLTVSLHSVLLHITTILCEQYFRFTHVSITTIVIYIALLSLLYCTLFHVIVWQRDSHFLSSLYSTVSQMSVSGFEPVSFPCSTNECLLFFLTGYRYNRKFHFIVSLLVHLFYLRCKFVLFVIAKAPLLACTFSQCICTHSKGDPHHVLVLLFNKNYKWTQILQITDFQYLIFFLLFHHLSCNGFICLPVEIFTSRHLP